MAWQVSERMLREAQECGLTEGERLIFERVGDRVVARMETGDVPVLSATSVRREPFPPIKVTEELIKAWGYDKLPDDLYSEDPPTK